MSVIDNFFSGLEKNKIQYIIFKNIDRIDESLSFEFNFDISINPKHKNNFYKYIKNYQIFEGVNIYDFMNINTEHYFLYEKGRFYHLHIHFGLILGSAFIKEYSFPVPQDFYSKFNSYNNIRLISDTNSKSVSELRALIKTKSIIGRVYTKVLKKKINMKINDSFKNIIKDNSLDQFKCIRLSFLKNLIAFILKFFQSLLGEVNSRKYYPGGLSIGISGTDGSGKSTVCNELFMTLKEIYFIKSVSFGRLTKQSNKNSKDSQVKFNETKKILAAIIRLFISYKLRFFKKMGYIVITDRYYNVNGPGIDSYKLTSGYLSKIERWLYSKIKPIDYMFNLKIPLEIAIIRNKNRSKLGKETDVEIESRYIDSTSNIYLSHKSIDYKNTNKVIDAINFIMKNIK